MKKRYLEILEFIKKDGSLYDGFNFYDFLDLELDRELIKINPKYYELFGLTGKADSEVMNYILDGALNDEYEIDTNLLKRMSKYADDCQLYKIHKLIILNSYRDLERSVEGKKSNKVKIYNKNFKN